MSDIVINYFTGNNGFFLPDLKPIPETADLDKLIFIESNPQVVTWIHQLINTKEKYSNYKNLKVFYYKLEDPTVVYRLLDFDPENIYFFLMSNGILFSKSLFKEMNFNLDIQNHFFIADNIHRLMQILKDTEFSIFLPSENFINKFIEYKDHKDALGFHFSEKFHLLHGNEIENVEIISYELQISNKELDYINFSI